jgi:uroporphyrinogen decarboxylase
MVGGRRAGLNDCRARIASITIEAMCSARSMSKSARVFAALRGEPVDRPPVSFWLHFGMEDESPARVAETELELLQWFDLDWLKVMHDFAFGEPGMIRSIRSPSEFRRIRPVRPYQGGFALQTEVLQRLAAAIGAEAPFIDTIHSPWSIAEMYCGWRLAEFARADREAVREGLHVIGDSLSTYVPEALRAGASGIFYVIHAEAAMTAEYADLVGSLDHDILTAAREAPFNVLHVHGAGFPLGAFTHYAVQALSFGSGESQIAEARARYAGALVTGMDDAITLPAADPDRIRDQIHRSMRAAGNTRFLLAPGCAVPRGVSEESLRAVREAVDSFVPG